MALRKRRVTFKNCFRKRGVPRKGGSLRKRRGGPTLEETMLNSLMSVGYHLDWF